MTQNDLDSDLAKQVEKLRQKYVASLPGKCEEIDYRWQKLIKGPFDPSLASDLVRISHQLAGSAGSYGFKELGHAAAAAESRLIQALDDDNNRWPEHLSEVDGLLKQLCQSLRTSS